MTEETDYGSQDGWADGYNLRPANPTNSGEVTLDSEYALAYMRTYEEGQKARAEEEV